MLVVGNKETVSHIKPRIAERLGITRDISTWRFAIVEFSLPKYLEVS